MNHIYQWSLLMKALANNRLPQAFLFSGQKDLGKQTFALKFIQYLNCQNPQNGEPCQKCQMCKLITKNSHPDVAIISPEKKEIQIDQIRDLQKNIGLYPSISNFKTVVLPNAHCLNQEAQNCFLKTLEEPKGKAIFFLTTAFPNKLLPTILSRCEQIKFYPDCQEKINPKEMEQIQNLLEKPIWEKLAFTKKMFDKNKEGEESLAYPTQIFLENLKIFLRSALLFKIGIQEKFLSNGNPISNLSLPVLDIKQAIEKTEDCQAILQNTNASPRLAVENLLVNI